MEALFWQRTFLHKISMLLRKRKSMYFNKKRTGIDFTTLREIKLLKEIDANQIIKIVKIYYEEKSICIVMPYYNTNLASYIRENKYLDIHIRKYLIYELL